MQATGLVGCDPSRGASQSELMVSLCSQKTQQAAEQSAGVAGSSGRRSTNGRRDLGCTVQGVPEPP